MREREREREKLAEDFLRGTKGPSAPRSLRDFGLQKIMTRASSAARKTGWGERKHLRHPAFLRRAVAVPLISLLLLAGATSGVYAASTDALPGSSLYASKIFFERARVAFTPSRFSDARLEMDFCRRRILELQKLLDTGSSRGWDRWLREYRRNLEEAESLLDAVSPTESHELSVRFQEILEEQSRMMEEMHARTSAENLPYLEQAYRDCLARMMRLRQRCGGGGAERNQPGMNPPRDGDRGPGNPGGGERSPTEGAERANVNSSADISIPGDECHSQETSSEESSQNRWGEISNPPQGEDPQCGEDLESVSNNHTWK